MKAVRLERPSAKVRRTVMLCEEPPSCALFDDVAWAMEQASRPFWAWEGWDIDGLKYWGIRR